MVFWWTGRGYLALLSLVGVYGLFGAVVTYGAGEDAFDRYPWLWGIGALLSAVATWYLGCQVNKKALTLPRPMAMKAVRDRLIYKARNRFLSLPLETWAFPMVLLGAYQIAIGLAGHS